MPKHSGVGRVRGVVGLVAISALWLPLVASSCDLDPLTVSPGSGGAGGSAGGQGGDAGDGGEAQGGAGGDGPPPDPKTLAVFDDVRITSNPEDETFHRATATVELPSAPVAEAVLRVSLATTCFPFETWQENPPPAGHNWPADCDAFDRNFEFSIDNPTREGEPPGIEILRAITPFGGPMEIEVDITDVVNGLDGPHDFQVEIPTYSDGAGIVTGADGGWNVTASIVYVEGEAPREVLAVLPLYYGTQTDQDDPGALPFALPEGTTSARVEYRATGHGSGANGFGCIGPAEEFCKRDHTISIDGAELETVSPFRDDCEQFCTLEHYGPDDAGFDYCAENPCGAISSVKASRANWCPGAVSPPFTWEPERLSGPGSHDLSWAISFIAPGGNWRLSATVFAFGSAP